jgi:hypothetical protein
MGRTFSEAPNTVKQFNKGVKVFGSPDLSFDPSIAGIKRRFRDRDVERLPLQN